MILIAKIDQYNSLNDKVKFFTKNKRYDAVLSDDSDFKNLSTETKKARERSSFYWIVSDTGQKRLYHPSILKNNFWILEEYRELQLQLILK